MKCVQKESISKRAEKCGWNRSIKLDNKANVVKLYSRLKPVGSTWKKTCDSRGSTNQSVV